LAFIRRRKKESPHPANFLPQLQHNTTHDIITTDETEMPKRKFSDLNDRPSGAVDIKLARLTAKFENGVTALSRALKTARAFERQKLGRREKTAKSENKPEALARIEEEIRVIKVGKCECDCGQQQRRKCERLTLTLMLTDTTES
jgi:exonuclease III